jgi:predicted RND superfamily exporter protein
MTDDARTRTGASPNEETLAARMQRLEFGALARLVTTWPRLILALLTGLTLLAGTQLPRLQLDASAEGVLLDRDPERALLDQLATTFGLDEILIVAINTDDIFQPEVLETVERLTDAFWQIDGVVDVISLTTTRDIVGTEDGFSAPLLIDSIPRTPEAMAELRQRVVANPIYDKHLVSSDGKTTAVNVFLEVRPDDRSYRARIVGEVEALVEKERNTLDLYVVGIPKTKVAMTGMMARDLLRLTPITVIVLSAMLYLCFGTLRGVLLPLCTVGMGLVWTFGLMARSGTSVSIVTTFLPSLVMMVGTSYVMYIVSRYYENVERKEDARGATFDTLRDIGGAVTISGITTTCGIAALSINDVITVKDLGAYGAFGVLATLLISLTFVPACLTLLKPRRMTPPLAALVARRRPTTLLRALGDFNLRNPGAILISGSLVLLLVAVGATRVRVETDYVAYFPPGSEIPVLDARIHRELSGHVPVYAVVEADEPGAIIEPAVLSRMADLQRFAEGIDRVDASLSLADYVRKMHEELYAGRPESEWPGSRRAVAQYLFLYGLSSPTTELWHYVSEDRRQANVLIRTDLVNSAELGDAIRRIEERASQLFAGSDYRTSVTGTMVLLNKTGDVVARGQVLSLAIAFAAVSIVLLIVLRSASIVALSLVPNMLPVAVVFGAMGFSGVHLTTGTSIIASLVFGIAVDDTVHYLMRYYHERAAGHDLRSATRIAISGVGRPMIFTSLALCGGFLVFLNSEFSPLVSLGGLAAVTMIGALVADLLLLPALLIYRSSVLKAEPLPRSRWA